MGLILEPTAHMGDIEVEVRSRSVIVHGCGVFIAEDGVIELNLPDIRKLKAALEQAEGYLASKA